MKNYLVFMFMMYSIFLNAQISNSISVNWSDKKEFSVGQTNYNIPQFDAVNFVFNSSTRSILYATKIFNEGSVSENDFELTNLVTADIGVNDLAELDLKLIPTTTNFLVKNIFSRDETSIFISFSPIIKIEGTYKKVLSLQYKLKPLNSGKFLSNNNVSTISSSVLSSGKWNRFYVEKSGVYKVTKSFLEQIGFNVNGIDPKKIKIYGNGGRMLPLSNAVFYPTDLTENAVQVIGESDGVFNNDDYILYYAEGLDNWSPENGTHLNLYENKSFYFVTVDGSDGKRIGAVNQIVAPTTLSVSTYDDVIFHEIDLTNIGKVGRVFFGEPFAVENIQQFDFSIPNINTSTTAQLEVHVGGSSITPTSFEVKANNIAAGTLNLGLVLPNTQVEAADNLLITNISSAQNISIQLLFNNNGVPTSKGYLDYIRIKSKSNLVGFGKQFRFQYDAAATQSGVIEYQFTNAASIKAVWDITDIYNVQSVNYNQNANFSIKTNLGVVKKFIALDEVDFFTPLKDNVTSIANQDLQGTIFKNEQGNFQDIDYIILAPPFLIGQAERLAAFHRSNSNLNTKVVNLNTLYMEFGGAKQDIAAIRNFMKYVYFNASSPSKRIKYLNLFGDASFDYKNRIQNNTNIVPIYQSLSSTTSTESSFPSDDFFALMDANEGDPVSQFGTVGSSAYGIDIAVGRMLVASAQQADEMVDKVLQYYDIKSYGSWRNNYVAISDDTDKQSDITLQVRQNNLTDNIFANRPFINFKKILLDGYQQQSSAGGDRYPQAKEDLRNAFEKGALIFNYLGHGGEDGLTGERIWDKFDGANFNNQYRYPLFITITCDFSKFDNPLRPTAGEYTYWNPKGGAISMITTVRTIGQSTAENLNDVIENKLFAYSQTNYPTIAEALRQTKNASFNNSASRVIFYIGDPALMLAIPKSKIVLTKINDVLTTQTVDDLKALSYVKLSGEIQDENGAVLPNFTGELFVNIFDKSFLRTTYNNDGFSPPISYNNLGETIFRGNASVTNGAFEFGFVVPKDIKIPVGNGRISFYAKQNQQLNDKTGYDSTIKIGGLNTNAVADVTPPKVQLYMNDETFVNGGVTNQSPFFLAFLEDEHGINTASGIGHDIVAILDGDETKPFILNDYFETELNNYKIGKIRFPLRGLAKGQHAIKFKVWDVYNNYMSAEIQFVVAGDEDVTLSNVLNYPNPFVNYTQFWFSHNKPFEPLEVQIQVMTITGKVVRSINQNIVTDGFLSREITWDGKDDFGDAIGKGVYIYKLTVKATLSNKISEKIEKLVIL
jgi:hypothetical protein